ncbi:MAG TPA: condensation domain-containing protein, partial [Longimicrobiaceae bacterium]|nr:condensation domain-containing protein [Longimicrobiaceae bacterium]
MALQALLAKLQASGIQLRKSDGALAVSGGRGALDQSLVSELRVHKAALLDMIQGEGWWSPPPIRPEMLTLVELNQAEIERIVAAVPGGARNVQDVYPLAPLQEGIFFHHLLATEGDPYLQGSLSRFDGRASLDAYLGAMQAVIDRHDVLRTAVVWEGLPEPVQVVWREARLGVEEVELDPTGGDAATRLWARFGPRSHRLDVRRAPMMRVHFARDGEGDGWVMLWQQHHLIGDHVSSDVFREEIRAHLRGRADELPAPLPFRNYVAQARLGVSRAEHEAYFRELLGDVDEPTAPFG